MLAVLIFIFVSVWSFKKFNFNQEFSIGQKVDSLNGVYAFYNGEVNHVLERNITTDGYNLGLKYQCVEFVKRYYYEYLGHKMPDSMEMRRTFIIISWLTERKMYKEI